MRLRSGPAALAIVAGALALSGCASSVVRADPPSPTAPVAGLLQVVDGCPAAPAATQRSALAGASSELLPFTPSAFLLCRYGGLNSGRSGRLLQDASLSGPTEVAALAAALGTGNAPWGQGIVSCPADFGTATTIYAHDPSAGGWLVLHADRTGCPTIRNGIANDHIGPALAATLTREVGAPGM